MKKLLKLSIGFLLTVIGFVIFVGKSDAAVIGHAAWVGGSSQNYVVSGITSTIANFYMYCPSPTKTDGVTPAQPVWYGTPASGGWNPMEKVTSSPGWYVNVDSVSFGNGNYFSMADQAVSYNVLCGGGDFDFYDAPTSGAPALSVLFPAPEGTTTPIFDNAVITAMNVTSTDLYYLEGYWYFGFNQVQYPISQVEYTGAQLEAGVNVPFFQVPTVCPSGNLCTYVGLPVNLHLGLYYDPTSLYSNDLQSEIDYSFLLDPEDNSTSTNYYYIHASSTPGAPPAPGAPGGGVTVTSSTQPFNPFQSYGTVVCSRPDTTFFQDPMASISFNVCQLGQMFMQPSKGVMQSFGADYQEATSSFPISYVIGTYQTVTGVLSSTTVSSSVAFTIPAEFGHATSTITILDDNTFIEAGMPQALHDEIWLDISNVLWACASLAVLVIIITP